MGYAPGEVLGRRSFELVHPDDAPTMQQTEQAMGGMLQCHFRHRCVHKDGNRVDIQWSLNWLPDYRLHAGVTSGLFLSFTDIYIIDLR